MQYVGKCVVYQDLSRDTHQSIVNKNSNSYQRIRYSGRKKFKWCRKTYVIREVFNGAEAARLKPELQSICNTCFAIGI